MDPNTFKPDFSKLPAHIITHILEYLTLPDLKKARMCCRLWQYASIDPIIMRTIALRPKEEDLPEITRLNRKYGGLTLHLFYFDKANSCYLNFFEKFCPFINKLRIIYSDIDLFYLLKLLELTTCLEAISLDRCALLAEFTELFPPDYNCDAKNRIVKKLSSIKQLEFKKIKSYGLIADLVCYTPNLETFKYSNPSNDDSFIGFFTIFENYDATKLRHLDWNSDCSGYIDDFIEIFFKIRNLNLKTFKLYVQWNWKDRIYKRSIFRQFILKLQSLMEFRIQHLKFDQLSIVCQNLINLKSLDCSIVDKGQPIFELANLKQLEELRIGRCYEDFSLVSNTDEIDQFFKCKFEFLRIFKFEKFVTEPNLVQLCENHPNLIELQLNCLLTRNLEIIFKYLTKLQILYIYFGFKRLRPGTRDNIPIYDSNHEYEYKPSRLQDLEVFYLGELVAGIHENDIQQLKKLRSTNLPELFGKTTNTNVHPIIEDAKACFPSKCNIC